MGHIRRFTVGVFPTQIQVTILALRTLAHVHWPAFSAPSTFFQLAEPLSTTCSSTRSASRQFVTFTVTVPPAGVFGFGLDFMGAAAAGADFEFCASAGAATTANSAAAIVTAIRLLMNLLRHRRKRPSCRVALALGFVNVDHKSALFRTLEQRHGRDPIGSYPHCRLGMAASSCECRHPKTCLHAFAVARFAWRAGLRGSR